MRHPAREWEARRSTLEDEISERVKAEVHAALERELDKGK
jgi:hypothetical protein